MSSEKSPADTEGAGPISAIRSIGVGAPYVPDSERTPPISTQEISQPVNPNAYMDDVFTYTNVDDNNRPSDGSQDDDDAGKGGFQELASMAGQGANPGGLGRTGGLHTRSHYQVKHHFGVHLAELLSGNLIVPRLLVFLCEDILRTAVDHPRLFDSIPNQQRLNEARVRFNDGHFYDPGDPVVTATLLKQFCREVPISLIPPSLYDRCLVSILDHLHNTKLHFQNSKYYKYLMEGRSETLDDAFNAVLNGEYSADRDEPTSLTGIIMRYAFNVSCEIPALREVFFDLPRVHRNALEYLGVFFAKLMLHSQVNRCTSDDIARVFAQYIIRPQFWPSMTVNTAQRKFLTDRFLVMFLYFLKKKHNILTTAEREELDKSDDQVMANLVMEAVPSTSVLTFASKTAPAPTRRIPSAQHQDPKQIHAIEVNIDSEKEAHKVPMYPGETVKVPVQGTRKEDKTLIQGFVDNLTDMGAQMFTSHEAGDTGTVDAGNVGSPNQPIQSEPDSPAGAGGGFLDSMAGMFKSGAETVTSMFDSEAPNPPPVKAPPHRPEKNLKSDAVRIKREHTGSYVLKSWDSSFARNADDILRECPQCFTWLHQPAIQPHSDYRDTIASHAGLLSEGGEESPSLPSSSTSSAHSVLPAGVVAAPGRGLLATGASFETAWAVDTDMDATSNSTSRRGSVDEMDADTASAINYDAAISFPSTVNHIDDKHNIDVDTSGLDDMRRHKQSGKAAYKYDTSEELLNHQNVVPAQVQYCEQCNFRFSHLFSARERSYCHYCGRTLCSDCCNRQFFLPSAMLVKGDLALYDLCVSCKNHLSLHVHQPALDYTRLTEEAMNNLGHMDSLALNRARSDIVRLVGVLLKSNCSSSPFLLGLIPKRYLPFLRDPPRISIHDIIEMKNGKYMSWLTYLEQLIRLHISQCRRCETKINQV